MSAQRTSWVLVLAAIVILSGGESANADFDFGTPTILGLGVNRAEKGEILCCISPDGLEMYIQWGTGVHWDLRVSRRATTDSEWGVPEDLGSLINTTAHEGGASISSDGLTLYFGSERPDGQGYGDIWFATRASLEVPWGPPTNVGSPVNTSWWEGMPFVSPDELELHFVSYRSDGYGQADIWVTRRATKNAPWEEPVNLGPTINSGYYECLGCVSPDGLLLFFSEHTSSPWRPEGFGQGDLWVARRPSIDSDWGAPVNLGPTVNGPFKDVAPELSRDGRTLYFSSGNRPENHGKMDIWQAPILPVVDFNGDGKANGKDVVVLTQHWGQTDPVCDIGPYAWGDGIVNEQDLFMLAEYLEKEVVDPTLVAHWALDETEGMMAADSAGDNDAMVMGDPAWQPDGGSVGGALALDGIDDCIVTNPVPELSQGPFSLLAWVKGGAADEAIISSGTADWLYTNPADGSLMTALSSIAGNGVPLFSDEVITDGQWHRIGLLWDGTDRILYVDEQEVARDEQAELVIPDAALIIGAGATPNRFFSGQIDDLRIYRRAVKP